MSVLKVVGQTTDGRPVLGGVYRFFETHGVPLDIIRDVLAERGFVIGWDCFYEEATRAGIGHRKILARMTDALPHHPALDLINQIYFDREAPAGC